MLSQIRFLRIDLLAVGTHLGFGQLERFDHALKQRRGRANHGPEQPCSLCVGTVGPPATPVLEVGEAATLVTLERASEDVLARAARAARVTRTAGAAAVAPSLLPPTPITALMWADSGPLGRHGQRRHWPPELGLQRAQVLLAPEPRWSDRRKHTQCVCQVVPMHVAQGADHDVACAIEPMRAVDYGKRTRCLFRRVYGGLGWCPGIRQLSQSGVDLLHLLLGE